MKFKMKLMSKLILPVIFTLIVINMYTFKIVNKRHQDIADEKIEIFNMSLQNIITDPLWKYDLDIIKEVTRTYVDREEINQITVYNDKMSPVASYISKTADEKDYKVFQIPIMKLGNSIGYISVGYSDKLITQTSRELKRDLYYMQLIFVIFFFSIILIYSRGINRAILKISNSMREVLEDNLDVQMNLNRKDEFKSIEYYFNKLINKLRNNKIAHKRNVEEFTHTKEELEAAYNQMISINGVLETTLTNLELSEGKYKNIFKYSPFGIVLYNIEGDHIIECNNELLYIFDTESEFKLEELFERESIPSIIRSLYHSKEIEEEELYLQSVQKTVIVSVIPFKDKDKFIQVFFKDITELKNLQIKLQNYAKDLEREVAVQTRDLKEANDKIKSQQQRLVEDAYNKGLVEVTSGIIHNIGNIVNVISLNLDELKYAFESNEKILPKFLEDILLKELNKLENLDETLEKAVNIMPDLLHVYREFDKETNNKVEYLHRKVDHLKEIVQLQQNFVGSLGTEDYNDVNGIIDEVFEIYESSLTKRSIMVERDYTKKSSVLCDKAQIIQLISNFIKNSYEAIEEAQRVEGLIKVKTYNQNSYLVVEIEDNGIGVKEDSKEKLFEFGYSTKKHTGTGSGFGLHSCKEIVEKYGGTIEYESKYGEYTKFIINLPIARKG